MSAFKAPGHLSWQQAIVDKDGRPTPELLRYLQDITGNADTTNDTAGNAETVAKDALNGLSDKADKTTEVIAGAGLTGGGDLSADRTLDVGAGTGITVNANDVAIDTTAEAERIRDVIGSALVAGANVTITVDDPGNTITIASSGGSGGSWIPLVNGAEPPSFITDGAGNLILVAGP